MSERASSSASSETDESDWYLDVPRNLDTFVRLSRAGFCAKANCFYRDVLMGDASNDFAVAAQYAECLIEQGAFEEATKFLTSYTPLGSTYSYHERTIFELLLANARMYTNFDVEPAAKLALKALSDVGEVIVQEDMSPIQVRTNQQERLDGC